MSVAYEKTFELDAVNSGTDNYFELRFPARGTLRKIVCVQLSGDNEGFELDIFNSKEPMEDAMVSPPFSSANDQTFSSDAYKIIPTQDIGANDTVELMNCEYPYKNQDGTATRHIRKLYARVRPAGSGEKDFQLTLAVEMPEQ